jgi:hypothetical protein
LVAFISGVLTVFAGFIGIYEPLSRLLSTSGSIV